MKKILITTKSMNIGGVETTLLSLLKNLDYSEYEVDLLLMDTGILLREVPKEVNIIHYQDYMLMPHKFIYGLKKNILVESLYNKYRFVFKKKYDIAIAFNGFDNYMDMVAGSVKAKHKIIWVHNDLKSALEDKLAKLYFNKMWTKMSQKYNYFDTIVCVSKYTKDNFDKMFPKYKKKTITINNLVDGNNIIDKSKEETPVKLSDDFNIVSIGRLTGTKNVSKLVDIHKKLIDNGFNVKTYIIGDGEEYKKISDKILDLQVSDSVMMLGELLNPYSVLKQASLLVSMSTFESFGNILLEAMILNVPFLSNINSGSRDIYETIMPINGGLVCSNDDMYENIIKFINMKKSVIAFDYAKYNKEIMYELNELLKKED